MEIFKLVRQHATGGQWSKWLRAPLEHAAAKGDMNLFSRLMDAGADGGPGWRGCHGRTLLGAAAYGKNTEVVVDLLGAGAIFEVDLTFGEKRESALHVAAMRGAEDVSDALILAGADPCLLDKDKQSPLHVAAEAGHDGVVEVLLLSDADSAARSKCARRTPLHLAAAAGHEGCVSTLIVSGADKDSRDLYSETPLHLAAQYNRIGTVEKLLAAGASHHIRLSFDGGPRYTALDMAAQRGHVDVVRALVNGGSAVTASNARGFTALHLAANVDEWLGRDNGDVIRLLLDAGADTEAKTKDHGGTPLHFAASSDSSGSNVLSLLEGGANVVARSANGYTPLHDACYHSFVGVVELLLRWGADEKLTDHNGKTAGETLGEWAQYGGIDEHDDERKADDKRIRRMLARAPADRSWRRRRWLALARSCPAKVQLTKEVKAVISSGGGGGSGGENDADEGGDDTGDQTRTDLELLVGRVVGLRVEGVFRSVVGFL